MRAGQVQSLGSDVHGKPGHLFGSNLTAETVAGFMMARLGVLPAVGQRVVVGEHVLVVVELDGRRAARVQVSPLAPDELEDSARPVDESEPLEPPVRVDGSGPAGAAGRSPAVGDSPS